MRQVYRLIDNKGRLLFQCLELKNCSRVWEEKLSPPRLRMTVRGSAIGSGRRHVRSGQGGMAAGYV